MIPLPEGLFMFLLGVVLLILSRLMIFDAMKFRRWYYDGILSSILAYRIDLEKSIKTVEPSAVKVEENAGVVNK